MIPFVPHGPLKPALRLLGLVLGLVALGAAWTAYQRHDAVQDYKRETTARNAETRAAEEITRQENANEARQLDDDALRNAIPQRLPVAGD